MNETIRVVYDGTSQEIYRMTEKYKAMYKDLDENACREMAVNTAEAYLENLKMNFDVICGDDIILIADIEVQGKKENKVIIIPSNNLNAIFDSYFGGKLKIYCDYSKMDIIAVEIHQDGTNRYTYRATNEDTNAGDMITQFMNENYNPDVLKRNTGSLVGSVEYFCRW